MWEERGIKNYTCKKYLPHAIQTFKKRRVGKQLKRNLADGETDPFFPFLRRNDRKKQTTPTAKKGRYQKNGGAASRTLIPAHGALIGILVKKVRQRTTARPNSNPGAEC